MSTITRTYHSTLERIIAEEIHTNASQMIDQLSRAAHSEGAAVDFDDLLTCCSAPDYSEPPEDYAIARIPLFADQTDADQEWTFTHARNGESGEVFPTEREAIQAAWEDAGDEPDQIEALQHWLVSDWLAEKLESIGALVARDILGFAVWGRTECGQGLDQDSDLQAVARLIDSQ